MKAHLRRSGAVCAWLVLIGGLLGAQSRVAPAPASGVDRVADFLDPYGRNNFSKFYKSALQAWLEASFEAERSDHAGARQTLDALWQAHPTGGVEWSQLPTRPYGINIGSPPCYYGLRMLTDVVDWRLHSGVQGNSAPRSVRFTVLLVGQTHGIEPRSSAELNAGTGVPVTHALDPRLLQDESWPVRQSLELFEEYVFAMTEGNLAVDTRVVSLPGVDLDVRAYVDQGRRFAGLSNAADVWAALPGQTLEETDWWWLIYPSHVPEQYPDFQNAEFITGGMGVGEDGVSPLFLIDDRWLLRKPPHLGSGDYTAVERRAYLPQWLQHEFFHHLFRTYPQFGLEATSHQWFDLSTWPPDFQGRYEADYFHEAIQRRLHTANPPLHVALRYATADAPWQDLVIDDVLGTYRREPVENPWHIGTIQQVSGTTLIWSNNAGVSWLLDAQLATGELLTGPDCPYYAPPDGTEFQIVLERDGLGDLTGDVRGFAFNGELYQRQ